LPTELVTIVSPRNGAKKLLRLTFRKRVRWTPFECVKSRYSDQSEAISCSKPTFSGSSFEAVLD